MLTHDGTTYDTISDAARHFHVSTKTVKSWIAKGILPEPPTIERGLQTIQVFTDTYYAEADEALRRYREGKAEG